MSRKETATRLWHLWRGPAKRLSDAELARRMGLCFRCEGKFGPNHVCKNKNLQVMIVELDAEKSVEEGGKSSESEEENPEVEGEIMKMELSLNSISGFGSNNTMKVRGQLAKEARIILIDSGATHNFIA